MSIPGAVLLGILTLGLPVTWTLGGVHYSGARQQHAIALSAPQTRGRVSVEEAIASRRSVRRWSGTSLRAADLSQILWAAQGITSADGKRSVPSAGALYPLQVYVAVANVESVRPGVYWYVPRDHALDRVVTGGEPRSCLARAAANQELVARAPVVVVFTAFTGRTAARYGARAPRFVAVEVGAAMQNVYLEAEARGLGTVAVGAIDEAAVASCLSLRAPEEALLLMPIGRRPG